MSVAQHQGSMIMLATTVDEWGGILFDNFPLVERRNFHKKQLCRPLTDNPDSVRNLQQNVIDLKVRIAANEQGVIEFRKIVSHIGVVRLCFAEFLTVS